VDIEFMRGSLLEPFTALSPEPLTLLCNLPYVPDNFTINPAAMREPKIAIFGGPDGLDLYRQLFKQIKDLKLQVKYILTESMPPQHSQLEEIAEKNGYKQIKEDDFIQLFELKA
jgi:release factor glutamine methyltransferase